MQIGASKTDFVLLFMNEDALSGLLKDKFEIAVLLVDISLVNQILLTCVQSQQNVKIAICFCSYFFYRTSHCLARFDYL